MPFSKRIYLCVILLCVTLTLNAQTTYRVTSKPILQIERYDVLADHQYSLNDIITDSKLSFQSNGSINTGDADYYWIKMIVDNPYPDAENYYFSLSLPVKYTLYAFDTHKRKWTSGIAGMSVPNRQRQRETIPCVLQGATKNVLYLKIDLRDLKTYKTVIKPELKLEKEISFNSREELVWLAWLTCIIALVSFSLYNLYIYLHLKDQSYLYYMVTQAGAIIFITALKHFFNLFLPFALYNIKLSPDGSIYYYDLNPFFLHIGLAIIISGIIQLTRSYLRTKKLLPVYDKLLKFAMYSYMAYEIVPAILTISGLYDLDRYTLFYDNILILFIILLIILTSAVAYKHKVRAARHFLLANILPLIFISACASYFIFNASPAYTSTGSFLPEMAILSQVLTFAVALVARIRLVNNELNLKELEAGKLEADIVRTEQERLFIEQENEQIIVAIQHEKDKNELLHQKLEVNQRELIANSLYINQKNKLLADLKKQIQDIDKLYPHVKHPAIKNMESSLRDGQHLDTEWDKFKLHFEQVHPNFFEDLQYKYPTLTKNELRLYAYFHINLSTKEIAILLHIAPASVRQAKARLNKKMTEPSELAHSM